MSALMVIVAAVVNFVIGAIWYGIFGRQWMLAWKLSPDHMKQRDPKPYLIAFIGSLWVAYGLFLAVKHIKPQGADELIAIAVGLWLFIHVGLGAKHYAFANVNGKAFAIDYLLDLVGLIIMSLIINL